MRLVLEFSALILKSETTTFNPYENEANAHVPLGAWVVLRLLYGRAWLPADLVSADDATPFLFVEKGGCLGVWVFKRMGK
jgi:hypothetical protein